MLVPLGGCLGLQQPRNKTTTILGRLTDKRPLANSLGNVKSGMNQGGFNILNMPDKYYS